MQAAKELEQAVHARPCQPARTMATTACAASPSPAPIAPRPSLVLPFHEHGLGRDGERRGQSLAHRRTMRSDLVPLGDDRDVGVDHRPPGRARPFDGQPQHLDRVAARVGGVGVREQLADVAERRGAEHRVGERVRGHVAVGVRLDPRLAGHAHAGDDQRLAARFAVRHEAVRVVPDADAHRRAARGRAAALPGHAAASAGAPGAAAESDDAGTASPLGSSTR
jgi:hypothetical protein